jgi:hypothetical protein
MSQILCLSVRQPWAWLLMEGIKDVENRSWATDYRGTIALHASKSLVRSEYAKAQNLIKVKQLEVTLPPLEQLELGGVLGLIDIVDCVPRHPSPWYIGGNFAFVMANPRKGQFVPLKGQLGLFYVTYGV